MRITTFQFLLGFLVLIASCKSIPPQIARFEGPQSITRGDKAVLVWDIVPTKALQNTILVGMQDSLPIQGKAEVKPAKNAQYELKIQYKKGKHILTDSRKVDVVVEEPKVTMTVDKDNINIGDEALLYWELPHFASNVRLFEWVDGNVVEDWEDMPSHASYKVKPVKTAVYKLEYNDDGVEKSLERKIVVNPAFFTGTKKILAGEEAQLIWKTTPSMPHASLEQRENSYTRGVLKEHLPTAGTFKVTPIHTTEYLLSLIDEHHTTLIHKVDVVQGMISGQKVIKQGEKGFISWRVTPLAKKAWIETMDHNNITMMIQGSIPEEGKLEVAPHKTIEYLLAVETKEGTVERYVHKMMVTAPNEGNIYTQPNTHRYIEAHNPQHHHKGFSSLDDSPVTIEPHNVLEAPTKVFFDFDKSEIKEDFKKLLDEVIAKLKKDESAVAEITGHADLKGSIKGCDKVAHDRAEAIKKYFIDAGIPEYKLMTKSLGRMFPINYNETDAKMAQENRRAEIVILK